MKLRTEHFSLEFKNNKKWYPAVKDLNIEIGEGEMVALIGESGCGKSMTALSVMGLQPPQTRLNGHIYIEDASEKEDLTALTQKQWEKIRGKSISMIFQDPMTALNPLVKVGKQVREAVLKHERISKKEARKKVIEQFKRVGLPDAENMYECYPHQLSGGQRQRIMIAMAFINNPSLLIADEPTTALDVTIQSQIIELMKKMKRETNSAILLISHDLSVVKKLCSRVYIMYAGRVVESGMTEEVLKNPAHPYTKGLIEAIPDIRKRERLLKSIPGNVPGLFSRSSEGCEFCDRCEYASKQCKEHTPFVISRKNRTVSCWNAEGFEETVS